MIFKTDPGKGDLDGFIDGGSRLVGELHFKDTFRIDGQLEGVVHSQGNLVIGEQGRVEGDLRVRNVFVSGEFRGTIRDAQRVEIGATGRVYGEVQTQALVVEDGAILEGSSSMDSGSVDPGAEVEPQPQNPPETV